ncbi:MAG: ATP-binding protein, partial [Actinomycetota bacterium]
MTELPALLDPVSSALPDLMSEVFVGRQDELAIARALVERPPSITIVEGEAGVGKTRLVNEILRADFARKARVLVGHCQSFQEPFPLGPFVQALRALGGEPTTFARNPLAGALRPLLPEIAEELPPRPEPFPDPAEERHRVFRAVIDVLDSLGRSVIVLEDLHWADESTSELLSFLLTQFPADLSVLATLRAEEARDSTDVQETLSRIPPSVRSVRLSLQPLSPVEVGELIEGILGVQSVSDEFAGHLHERTSGLPFAVEEVLKDLHVRGRIRQEDGRWFRTSLDEMGVPTAIRDSIVGRLRLLPRVSRAIVEAAAILSEPADEGLLARVAGLIDGDDPAGLEGIVESAIRPVLDNGLLQELAPGLYGCRHALARQAIEEDLTTGRRRRLHLRAARSLEHMDEPPVARLAEHYRFAGGHIREWARYALAAAERAASSGDPAGAVAFIEPVLTCGDLEDHDSIELGLRLGSWALDGMAHARAIPIIRALLEEVSMDSEAEGELRWMLGRLLAQSGDLFAARAEYLAAVPHLDDRPDLAARTMSGLALPTGLAVDSVVELREWSDRAIRAAERCDDEVLRLATLGDRAHLLILLGDREGWEIAERFPADAASSACRRELVRGWLNIYGAAHESGHLRSAQTFLKRSVDAAAAAGYERFREAGEMASLELDWAMGRWKDLEQLVDRISEADLAYANASVVARVLAGAFLTARGRLAEATKLLRPNLESWLASGNLAESVAA